jgi:DNA polymerase
LPDLQISKIHGQPKRIRVTSQESRVKSSVSADGSDELALVIMPLYHPASALYNGSMRQTLLNDFAKIPDVLKLIDK